MTALEKYLSPYGAKSAVARHLNIFPEDITRMTPATREKIMGMIRGKVALQIRKPGPKVTARKNNSHR